MANKLIVILGPTASGKTKLACQLAYKLNAGVLSADSRQVYKGMDIGTGKDLNEYQVNGKKIPYDLIDIVDAGSDYHVAAFQRDFYQAAQSYWDKKQLPILCGGTGLYLEAVLKKFTQTQIGIDRAQREVLSQLNDDELLNQINDLPTSLQLDTSTRKRRIRALEMLSAPLMEPVVYPDFEFLVIGLNPNRDQRRTDISLRLKYRLEKGGLIEEVKELIAKGISTEKLIFYGLEYKYVTWFLQNKLTYNELFDKLEIAIHQFSKRQMTYFRSMEKKGIAINWLSENQNFDEKINQSLQLIKPFY